MSDAAPSPMTTEAFIAWSMDRPEGERYELVAGRVVWDKAQRPFRIEASTNKSRLLLFFRKEESSFLKKEAKNFYCFAHRLRRRLA